MLKNRKFLLDQDCPMCKIYGHCFVKIGLIDSNTISPYQIIEKKYATHIDMNRASSEIALFDTATKETIYGIDAMIKIISQNHPFLFKVLHFGIIYFILKQMYTFISLNRKVIYPSLPQKGIRECKPKMDINYRIIYLLIAAFIAAITINKFASILDYDEGAIGYLLSFGFLVSSWLAIRIINKEKNLEYIGSLATLLIIGSGLGSIFRILLLNTLPTPSLVYIFIIFLFGLLLFEFIRRCKIIAL